MKWNSFRLATAVLVGTCSACATSTTRTNQDATYHGHPTRIMVVANLEQTGDGVSAAFERVFSDGVRACGGEVGFFMPRITTEADALSLDNGVTAADQMGFAAKLTAFAPDVILSMRVTHITLAGFGQKIDATVNSRVFDYRQKKVVWAGVSLMGMGGIWTTAEMRAKSLNDDLSGKLRAGSLIPKCGAATS
jgi:hypothetical protein